MKRIITGVVAVVLWAGAWCAQAEHQPQMQDALRLLREARAHPAFESLHQAKVHLEKAEHDKGGHRVKALELVEEAIVAHRDGLHRKAIAKIDQAIGQIEKGETFDNLHGR